MRRGRRFVVRASPTVPRHCAIDSDQARRLRVSPSWIFQVVSRRYDRGAIVLTSNRGFGDWNQVFSDSVVATAIVDRLLHNAAVINIRGHSYRMRAHQENGSPRSPKGGGATVR